MKTLIAIIGCMTYAKKGWHQVCRSTFIPEVSKYPGLDYRFFIGDNTPSMEKYDDEVAIQASCGGLDRTRGIDYGAKCRQTTADTAQMTHYWPQTDEVILKCEDDFAHLPVKLRGMIRWALDNNYDYFLRLDSDTYVDVGRYMASGFPLYEAVAHPHFGGGCGWTLGKRAMIYLATEPVSSFIDEVWAGRCLVRNQVVVHPDTRYSDLDNNMPQDFVTAHCGWKAGYEPQRMYDLHKRLRG